MDIEVIIADDHAVVIEGIKGTFNKFGKNIKIIGEASNGREVLEMAKNNPANVYILDISMPILNGIETTVRLMKMDRKSKVIILSMHDDRLSVEKAMKSGAKGYILKENASYEIVEAVNEVYWGKFFLSPKIAKFIVQGYLGRRSNYERHEKFVDLTTKEREVLQLIAEGFSSKEIAVQLKISFNTVHVHRNNIMQKLDIHKQADLIRYALKVGITHL